MVRQNVGINIKITEREKIFGNQEIIPERFIINMVIINTNIVLYKRRPNGGDLRVKEVLRFTYNIMKCFRNVHD